VLLCSLQVSGPEHVVRHAETLEISAFQDAIKPEVSRRAVESLDGEHPSAGPRCEVWAAKPRLSFPHGQRNIAITAKWRCRQSTRAFWNLELYIEPGDGYTGGGLSGGSSQPTTYAAGRTYRPPTNYEGCLGQSERKSGRRVYTVFTLLSPRGRVLSRADSRHVKPPC